MIVLQGKIKCEACGVEIGVIQMSPCQSRSNTSVRFDRDCDCKPSEVLPLHSPVMKQMPRQLIIVWVSAEMV